MEFDAPVQSDFCQTSIATMSAPTIDVQTLVAESLTTGKLVAGNSSSRAAQSDHVRDLFFENQLVD